MTYGIYAIYDNKACAVVGNFLHLYAHVAQAIRMFHDVAAEQNSMLARHPDDFDLVVLGTLTEHNKLDTAPDGMELILKGSHAVNLLNAANDTNEPANLHRL